MTVVCGAGTDCGRNRKAPISIDFLFLKQTVPASLRCEVSDNHVPYPALYLFSSPCLFNHPSANAFLLYFPVISVFLFLDLFPFLLKDIKTASVCSAEIHRIKLHLQFHLRSSFEWVRPATKSGTAHRQKALSPMKYGRNIL